MVFNKYYPTNYLVVEEPRSYNIEHEKGLINLT